MHLTILFIFYFGLLLKQITNDSMVLIVNFTQFSVDLINCS